MAEHNELGKKGEEIAAGFLLKLKWKILARNWRYKKDELDIIATHNNQLVIVEVKTRRLNAIERPQDAVNIPKQKRLIRAADAFIQEREIDLECRFDIISVIFDQNKYAYRRYVWYDALYQ